MQLYFRGGRLLSQVCKIFVFVVRITHIEFLDDYVRPHQNRLVSVRNQASLELFGQCQTLFVDVRIRLASQNLLVIVGTLSGDVGTSQSLLGHVSYLVGIFWDFSSLGDPLVTPLVVESSFQIRIQTKPTSDLGVLENWWLLQPPGAPLLRN